MLRALQHREQAADARQRPVERMRLSCHEDARVVDDVEPAWRRLLLPRARGRLAAGPAGGCGDGGKAGRAAAAVRVMREGGGVAS